MKRWLLLPITPWALVLPSQAADEPKSATTPDNADLSAQRNQRLPAFLHNYNWHRPHHSLNLLPPISRLPFP